MLVKVMAEEMVKVLVKVLVMVPVLVKVMAEEMVKVLVKGVVMVEERHLFQELLLTQQFPTHQELLHLFSNYAIVMDTLEIHQHSSNCLCQYY